MAKSHWVKMADRMPIEQRREYVSAKEKEIYLIANKYNLKYVMVIWISGIDDPEINSSYAFFSERIDADKHAAYWDSIYDDFVHHVYTNFGYYSK